MKKRLVAGLVAASLSAAWVCVPTDARCENTRCLATKQIKKVTKARIANAFKANSNRVRVKWATASKSRKPVVVAKAKIALETKPAAKTAVTVARARVETVKRIQTAIVNPATIKTLPKSETGTVRYTFKAPLRQQPDVLAQPAKQRTARAAPAKTSGGNSVVAMIESMAPQYGVPTWFALRIAKVESGYNPNARGSAGELGVFQMKCATARGIGYRGSCAGLLHARTGIQYGLKHLSIALKSSGGNLRLAASKHNGGLGRKSLVPKYVAQVF